MSYEEFLDYFANMDEDVMRTEQWRQKADIHELKESVQELRGMLLAVCAATGAQVPEHPARPATKRNSSIVAKEGMPGAETFEENPLTSQPGT